MNDRIIQQLIEERDRIDAVIKLLSSDGTATRGGFAPETSSTSKRRRRRKMSKEARERIAAAQKAQWAKARAKKA